MNNQQQVPPQQPTQPIKPANNNSAFLKTLSIGLGIAGVGIVIAIMGYLLMQR